MQQVEILLKKRKNKAVLYIGATILCSIFAVSGIVNIIMEFEWFAAILGCITLIGAIMFGMALIQYFTYGKVWLVVESNGETLEFSNRNEKGKVFNKAESVKLTSIKSFYIIKKSTRYFAKNYAFGYDKGGIMSKEEISAFPALFDATQQEMHSVLSFVQSVNPNIELGYENFFQRLAGR